MSNLRSRACLWAAVTCSALILNGGPAWSTAAPPGRGAAVRPRGERATAALLMERALVSIRRLRADRGLPIDPVLDPNGTGIVGEEFTPLTTSLGDVEAKRTAANPAFAAAVTGYFLRARLRHGDVVAVGASGSFPSLLLAALCSARVLGLHPVVIYSVGASMYGANLPGFTFVDMIERLRADGVLPYTLAAVSPGGDADAGRGVLFDDEGTALLSETRRSGLHLVAGTSLEDRIADRLRIYDRARAGRPIRCYVNVGGAVASYGDTEASLSLPNGLLLRAPGVPASPTRGVLFEFASRGVPIVHLLNVRGLALENGVPFDPVPLPRVADGPGESNR